MNFSHLLQVPSITDWFNLSILFAVILALILISEFIRKKYKWQQEVTRKIVHISIGLLIFLTPILIEASIPLVVIAVFFSIFNFFALRNNLFPGIHIDRHNYGTVYYALSFLILIVLFWYEYKIIVIASMMVMALGDATAAIVGQLVKKKHYYILIHDHKSWEGSLIMFMVSSAVIYLTLIFYSPTLLTLNHSNFSFLLFALFTAMIATAAETLGNKGNDNLTVPLLSAVLLYFFLTKTNMLHFQMYIGILFGALVAYMSFRAKFLKKSGAMTTFILASIIFGFGAWAWTTPILTFFILSSLLSKISKPKHEQIFEKGSQRDYLQVLANGGIPGFLMIVYIFFPKPEIFYFYLGALAAAMADTWATEIGMLIGQRPRLISNFKLVPSGTSGGITWCGSLGAFIGALILGISGIKFIANGYNFSTFTILSIVAMSGFLGSLVDSFLGATVQVQYQCEICNKITEKRDHCLTESTKVVTGVKWITNDMVNFFNTVVGALLSMIMSFIFLSS